MSGRELCDRLRRTHPHVNVLYVSGYIADVITHHGMLEAGTAFLPKPFSPVTLASKVREVLDQTR